MANVMSNEMLQMSVEAIHTICIALGIAPHDITEIEVLKKGMTNRSFTFTAGGEKYIMRVPGEGTNKLIDRVHEAAVYKVLEGRGICDDVVYIDAKAGFKISRFIGNARVCNPYREHDIERCMKKLRAFHEENISVEHEFDLFAQVEFYENLMQKSSYNDYEKVKALCYGLRPFIAKHGREKTLCHIDSVPDNFLFVKGAAGEEKLLMIDWEYAGMQDPHVDIAMFIVYAMYDHEYAQKTIVAYFNGEVDDVTLAKIHCYIALCGLLWSNWCEYKRALGVEFGEYATAQYGYAREYSVIAAKEIEKLGERA